MSDNQRDQRLSETDGNPSSGNQQVGSFRQNSFFELYNNQNYVKSDLNRKPSRASSNSFNRSEEDEESNLNDDLNFDDLGDFVDKDERNDYRLTNEIDSNDEEEELDKFDEDDNENEYGDKLIENLSSGIPINQRYRKERSNSNRINEDCEFGTSFKQMAKSLPVTVPTNFKSFGGQYGRRASNHRNTEDNLDWFSVKDKPEDIAESIKALAKSVRGTELFGDLPSRKFNTTDFIRGLK